MSYISANGSLVEPYQIEILQKAVASDLLSESEESIDELLEKQEEKHDTTRTVGSNPTNSEKAKS